MKKLLLLFILLIAVVALVLALLPARRVFPSVTLPDGTTVRVVGVTYGTNHVHGPILYRMAMRSPAFIRGALPSTQAKFPNWRQYSTPTAQLVVWLELQNIPPSSPTNPPQFFHTDLGDEGNRISGSGSYFLPRRSTSQSVTSIQLDVFPRRSKQLTLNFFSTVGPVTNLGSVRFDNPFARDYAQWKPEPLPATKTNGNVELTLAWVETGLDPADAALARTGHETPRQNAFNPGNGVTFTAFVTRLHMLSKSDESWKVDSLELSDATGNQLTNLSLNTTGWPAESYSSFSPSLWPDEDAWKFKFLLRQTAGFGSNQIFVFHNVPLGAVGATNLLGWNGNLADTNWSAKFQGVKISLDFIVHRPPFNLLNPDSLNGTELQFTTSVLPRGTYLDLLWCTIDSTNFPPTDNYSGDGARRTLSFNGMPASATNADFVFAIHQKRSIEFLVHPDVPTNSARDKQP